MVKRDWMILVCLLIINVIAVFMVTRIFLGEKISICCTILSIIAGYCLICYNKNKRHIED